MQAPDNVRTPPTPGEEGFEQYERMGIWTADVESRGVEVNETDSGQVEITVPTSSTQTHRSGSRMAESALESMASQYQSGRVGLWDDHGLDEYGWPEYRREDMYGWWVDGEVDDNGVLWGTARLLDGWDQAETLLDQLDQGAPVAFSVGYIPTEEDMIEADDGDFEGEEQRVIFDVDLLETSPVGIPDNPAAYAAGATGRMVAHKLASAGIDPDRWTAENVSDGVLDALETMGDEESARDEAGTDDGGEAADGTEGETNEGEEAEQNEYSEDEVREILDTVGENLQSAISTAMEETAEALLAEGDDEEDDDDDDGDEEGAEGDEDDDDDEEESSADVPEEVQSELEELRAKVDRLESETRESAGRKGMAVGTTEPDESEDGDAGSETNGADTKPRNALDEAAILGE